MSLSRTLATGASSMNAHQQMMDVISNNIANTSTIGFKSSRANFADQFSQFYNSGTAPDASAGGIGGTNPLQYGLGVKVGSVTQDLSQGIVESTNRPLDLALQGDGYFVYKANGKEMYSRAGAITRDKAGYLVDSSTGSYMQGYNMQLDANGKATKDATGVNVLNRKYDNLLIPANITSPPQQTQNVNFVGNLNSSMPVGDARTTSIDIFDVNGGLHSLGFTYTKTANANEFGVTGTIDGKAVNLSATTIKFNQDGTLNTPMALTVKATDLNTAIGSQAFDQAKPKDITITLASANNITGGLTQYAGLNTATPLNRDGFAAGDLLSLSVDEQGKILGGFSNGNTEVLGQVVVAKFTNPGGLTKEGNNYFSLSPNSGTASIGTAGEIFQSTKIAGQALEQSNVDLTTEFVNMISTQRAFEAGSRVVTTGDQILQLITMLKR